MFTVKFSKNIKSLRNLEVGRRAFILGNGPSIKSEDLSRLKGELVIGMNASTMLEKEFGFVQSYYVCSDVRFISHEEKRKWATVGLNGSTKRVMRSEIRKFDDPLFDDRTWYVPAISRDGFSENLESGFFYGCTTTMMAIQLAYHLGVDEVYLLGVDLRYSEESPRFYLEKDAQLEDSNTSVQIFNICKSHNYFSRRGGGVYNCSSRSFLSPYLKTISLGDVL